MGAPSTQFLSQIEESTDNMRSVIPLLSLSALLVPVQSLYFYIEGTTPKCFFEELPKDTLVVGHYDAEEFDEDRKTWSKHDQLNILITVDEVFDNDHRVVNQKGSHSGRFTFSAADSGDHKIQDIVKRVKDLNGRLQDIRREQVFQREREAEFRDQSETTNARVVRWTLVQLVVLGITCAWQLSHLRSFFIKQKLT